ncbi:nucleoside hydrolase [Halococcus sp. IIIV-5B]|uniref:nucleoside hydrolase n=1 Tax=Halococcus sp. IIIV-5B TaxID=2321230 RepID=UPI000E707B33|nr:nucleoside hydrolase [Halococcus sp. IIIV-5B]RJT05344.1 nucleoside hydrolase [Halococcus sp. IIIV-5B]
MSNRPRRVIVDTDTAGDDSQALLLAAATDRVAIEGVTIGAGNVAFDRQVENAKYTLDLAGVDDVTVYEGARGPLLVPFEHADHIHGEGGLGGERFPETGIPSGDAYGPDFIVERARENPGEFTLVCLAPLTNVALALRREPDLGELLDSVWVMGGNANCPGNVTPAAEYNFWVDPHAARKVLRELDVTLFDWGVSVRDATFDGDTLDGFAGIETEFGELFGEIADAGRAFNRETHGEDQATQPDPATMAAVIAPSLVEEAGTYHVAVDDREGLTRGYSAVDENGLTEDEPRTRVVESFDGDRFEAMFRAMLRGDAPETALE